MKSHWNHRKTILYLGMGVCALLFFSCIGEPMDKNVSAYYRKSWNSIYYKETSGGSILTGGVYKLASVDAGSFKPLSQDIGVDKNSVFYKTNPQPQIDRASFQVKEDGTIRDKNHIYVPNYDEGKGILKILYNVDLESYGSFKGHATWAYDKDHVYFHNSIPVDVDRPTFAFLTDKFMKDKNYLYTLYFDSLRKRPVDTAALVVLNNDYLRNDHFIFFSDTKLNGEINTISFRNADSVRALKSAFLIIDNQVYHDGYLFLEGKADAASFQVLDDFYSQDKASVFCNDSLIASIDRTTFKVMTNGLGKDKNSVYYWGVKLEGVDASTFHSINTFYHVDKSHVYFIHAAPNEKNFFYIVKGADPEKFSCSKSEGELWGFEGRTKKYYYGYLQ